MSRSALPTGLYAVMAQQLDDFGAAHTTAAEQRRCNGRDFCSLRHDQTFGGETHADELVADFRVGKAVAQISARHCGVEFPGFGLLLARNGERTLEIVLHFCYIRLRRLEDGFAGHTIDLGLAPFFLCGYHRRHCFTNALPTNIDLADCGIADRQD